MIDAARTRRSTYLSENIIVSCQLARVIYCRSQARWSVACCSPEDQSLLTFPVEILIHQNGGI